MRILHITGDFNIVPQVGCATDNIQKNDFSKSFEDRQAHVKVKVSFETPLEYGMCFELESISQIENMYNNQASFNYKKYMKSKMIIFQARASSQITSKSSLLYTLKNVRNAILTNNCESDNQVCQYTNAIIFGNKEIDSSLLNTYGQIGIAPIFAISGMHITIIYEVIIWGLSKARIVITKANIIALVLLIIYSVLAGSSASVNRALMMIILKVGLKLDSKYCLAIAFIISLFLNPFNLLNSGYILSYGITLAIIIIPKDQFENQLINLLIFSSLCYLIALPLSYPFNYTFNLLAPLAMILFMSLITTIIMPLSVVATLINFKVVNSLYLGIMTSINELAQFFDKFTVVGGKVSDLMWIVYLVIIYRIIVAKRRKLHILFLALWFVIVSLDIVVTPSVTFIDVGQGDAAIIKTKTETYIVDLGPSSSEVWKQARYEGIKQVDGLFISHPHDDHIGSLGEVANYLEIKKVYELAGNQVVSNSTAISEYISTPSYEIIPYFGTTENNRALIVKFKLNDYSILFTGDIELEAEQYLVENYCDQINSDILKVPHHGSKSSSSEAFIRCVSPEISVISSGKNNRYNHPSQDVVDEYRKYGVVYNTKEDGQVSFKVGKKIRKTSF